MNTNVVTSSNPNVQELIDRFNAHQEIDSGILDRGDIALMGAVWMEVNHNPTWHPTEFIEKLICDINARLGAWEKTH